MNIEIDDLPDVVLVKILCRLPCYKFVSKCKSVSKRWCNVMSGPYFLARFLRLQSDREQTPIIRTLITNKREEFLTRMSSSTKPLALLFERLMSSHHLEQEPVVVATYNDLVLCCTTWGYYQRDYYICNPCTVQWVPVPPPPRVYRIHQWDSYAIFPTITVQKMIREEVSFRSMLSIGAG
ncbi:putative F-box domain-containing protein [Rosa chinensis]|uniref:Putative F-box domain-containing protein n=1 Tax=Rosa chinensis TaxID=74649 RepID=A0A2P6S3L4_ROSCH|nr:putative F-box domain-containing protein [Rosa chinensis]